MHLVGTLVAQPVVQLLAQQKQQKNNNPTHINQILLKKPDISGYIWTSVHTIKVSSLNNAINEQKYMLTNKKYNINISKV